METRNLKPRQLTSDGGLAINQEIVSALTAALSEWRKERLDAGIAKLIISHLPSGGYYVNVWQDKSFGVDYQVRIHVSREHGLTHGVDVLLVNDKHPDYYAIRLDDSINVKGYSGEFTDWREQFQFMIDRFNHLDCYEWERITETVRDRIETLDLQAQALKREAEQIIASLPSPEHDPLNRNRVKSVPWDIQRLYPHLFNYRH